MHLENLLPATLHEISYLDSGFISFRTPNPSKFKFVAVSCQHTMSQSEVFSYIINKDPDLVIMLGDFHYSGHYSMNEARFEYAVHEVFKSQQMR